MDYLVFYVKHYPQIHPSFSVPLATRSRAGSILCAAVSAEISVPRHIVFGSLCLRIESHDTTPVPRYIKDTPAPVLVKDRAINDTKRIVIAMKQECELYSKESTVQRSKAR